MNKIIGLVCALLIVGLLILNRILQRRLDKKIAEDIQEWRRIYEQSKEQDSGDEKEE